jgi:DNA-binding NarL/FixJ family response regulator
MIRVLLVDDHAVVRAGYRRYLEQAQGEHAEGVQVVAEAGSAGQGYAAYCQSQPDVSVVDLSMPGASGVQLIQRILARDPQARVLAFSMHEQALFVQQAIAAGACGYITKNSAGEALVEAVRAAHAGGRFFSPGLALPSLAAQPLPEAGSADALSAREFEVFRLIARGLTLGEIADILHLSSKTVANHQTRIKEKLGVQTTAALVHRALQSGAVDQEFFPRQGEAP